MRFFLDGRNRIVFSRLDPHPRSANVMALNRAAGLDRFRLRFHTIVNLPVTKVRLRRVNYSTIVLSPRRDARPLGCGVLSTLGRSRAHVHVFKGPRTRMNHHVNIILYCNRGNSSLGTLHSGTGHLTGAILNASPCVGGWSS